MDGHEEGQGNPRVEAAIDSKMARSLFGLANYYHRFLRGFSKVDRTLSDLLKKCLSQECDKPCHQTIGELKRKLSSARAQVRGI